jgi:hypothetical protein
MSTFWIYEPKILIESENIKEIWPIKDETYENNLNAVTRLVMLLTIVGYVLFRTNNVLFSGFISIIAIIVLFFIRKNKNIKENFELDTSNKRENENIVHYEKATHENPLANVLVTDVLNKPERGAANPSYTKDQVEKINTQTKNMIKSLNPDIQNIDKRLFQDLGDQYQFDHSMRSFYSNPNTQIPNNQEEFAKFCYGNLPSRKTVNSY